MIARVIAFLSALLPILNPVANETKGQKVGTWVTLVIAILSAVVLALQVFGGSLESPEGVQKAEDAFEAVVDHPDATDAQDGPSDASLFVVDSVTE